MSRLEDALGHKFANIGLLAAALVHRSHTAEHPNLEHYERYEFLGDAVLQLAVTDYLFDNFQLPEGQMAKVRAASVSQEELARVAREIGLGEELMLGRGEEASGGREKDSILGDAMEAVIAAVYLDAGFETAKKVVLEHWVERVQGRALRPGGMDYKTRLQEILAATGRRPTYLSEGMGPDHAKVFTAEVSVDGTLAGKGQGRSKKEAEQAAARMALEAMQG
jgi:ribonuclease-3